MDNASTCCDKWIADRFEENIAVLENAATLETMTLPKPDLPAHTKPGDTLILRDGIWHVDKAETEARQQRIQERFNRIKARN